ncbi:Glutaredoxin [Macleaya cordata]|uniref:Glutaredoxin n=1 Tax=Macleaya cordata TaxID=56857 RepID=A0A200QX54_MACCD|nr:Glutaredoxin [Macleaya cordata]
MERNHFIPPSDFGVGRLASQSPVVIFSKSTCCMCHTIKTLFLQLGINPAVYELDQDPKGREMERVLMRLYGCKPAVPAVFIGGQLVGGANEVMSRHLNGTLITYNRANGR